MEHLVINVSFQFQVFSTSENNDFLITEPAPKFLANLLTGVENDAVPFQKVQNVPFEMLIP